MPNPFGITEVSLPQIYGAVEDRRMSRIQQMVAQRQLEVMERQADRDLQEQDTIARITGRTQGKPMGGAYQQSSSDQPATPAPAPASPTRLTPQQMMELRLAGPRGGQIADVYQGMTDQERALTERRATAGLRAARYLRGLPQERVMTEFQALVPDLVSSGFSQDELSALAQNGLTPEELDGLIQRGLMYAPSSYRNVGEEVIDERLLGTGQDPRVYASEYITTPDGVSARPSGRSFNNQPVQYRAGETREINGVTYRRNDAGQWTPVPQSEEAPAFRPAPGGAGSGQQPFP
jgi:hypothetical protein